MRDTTKLLTALAIGVVLQAAPAVAANDAISVSKRLERSVLVDDFVRALSAYGEGIPAKTEPKVVQLWMNALADRGVDPEFVRQRLVKASAAKSNFLEKFKTIVVEDIFTSKSQSYAVAAPVALHAFRLDVIQDYDAWTNDNIYLYFITTHDDMLWGKVTDIHKNLDAGTSVFLSEKDRALFGPKGQKLAPQQHLIVDVGLVESDRDSVAQLQKISDAIIDLAVVAVTIHNPVAGAAAAKARAETKNLMNLLIGMDQDDRLAVDSIYFEEAQIAGQFEANRTVSEFARRYSHETFWTSFDYRLRFRFLK
jgi:hypothetical protein